MKFNYQARTKNGLVQVGVVEVASKKEAVSVLQKEGLIVTYLESVEQRPFYLKQFEFFNRTKKKDIMIFCRQMALMLKSGVTLVDSLKSLAIQTTKPIFQKQILEISNEVEGGLYFSDALAKFPKVFSNFFINIIKSGEASGRLSETLNYLANHLEREYELNSKIKSGMTYPSFVVAVFLGIGVLGIFVVLPSFKETLTSLGIKLPALTRFVLGFGDFARKWWWAILMVLSGLILSAWAYIKTKEGKELMGRLSLELPLIGPVVKKTQLARFTENLSTLILAGLPITQALDIISKTTDNKVYQAIILEAQEGVRRGESMSSLLEQHPKYISPLVTQMIQVGESTGHLDEALMNVATFYHSEINHKIDSLVDIIEPILIVVLGVLVAGLMIAIIVPVYKGMSNFNF